MTNGIIGLIIGLIVGIYLAASYPDFVAGKFHSIGVPLLGHHATADSH
jgi:hypothetical protein